MQHTQIETAWPDVRGAGVAELSTMAEQLGREVAARFGGLNGTQLNWKPNAEEWSIGQCLDHLITANNSYFAPIEAVIAGRKATTIWERVPLLPALYGRMLIATFLPGSRQRVQAPRLWQPTSSAVDPQILTAFADQQARLVTLMRTCAEHGVEGIVMTSPAASFVTYSLLDALRIIVVHEQHHLTQTAAIMAAPGFPR